MEIQKDIAIRLSNTKKNPYGTIILLLFASLLLFTSSIAWGFLLEEVPGPLTDEPVEAVLVSEVNSIQPGTPFWVALKLKMQSGWHTYWKNPGEVGFPATIDWEMPEGFTAGAIQWPIPTEFKQGEIRTLGYADEVYLLVQITPPKDLSAQDITLKAHANWLACETLCFPGSADLALTLPVKSSQPQSNLAVVSAFRKTRTNLPQPFSSNSDSEVFFDQDHYTLLLRNVLPNVIEALESVTFYSENGNIGHIATPRIEENNGSIALVFSRNPNTEDLPEPTLKGVLHFNQSGVSKQNNATAFSIELPIQYKAPPNSAVAFSSAHSVLFPPLSLLGLAFLGGLILNLMPCVFPVLGIKLMQFVQQSGESARSGAKHGFVYTLGVLVSFWILAGVLIVLRASGEQLGWGFQLQSPVFTLTLAFILFIFGLNLSGLFEVGQSAVGVGSRLTGRSGLAGSFFSGALTSVVATPCAAPFLAPALGMALSLPAVASLMVFTMMAVGLAAPYLLLSSFPRAIAFLPKPGPWMETFRQSMAFLLYASAAYLLWVLTAQVEGEHLLKIFLAFVLVALGGWIYGRWCAPFNKERTRKIAMIAAVAVGFLAIFMAYNNTESDGLQWEKWSPEVLAHHQAKGNIVYVDFTARWCATCQLNKKIVFSSNAVRSFLKKHNIVLLKADWTQKDPRITQALAARGRSAVPLNLIYLPNSKEPIELPEILTPGIVLDALNQALRPSGLPSSGP